MTVVAEHEPTMRERAISRLEKKREFHRHLLTYVLINGLLWLIWGLLYAAGGTWFPWPVFPTVGWGVGLTFHAWETYKPGFSEKTVQREIEKLERDKAA